ncbi:hypothetical protein DMH25_07830 [Streptomyces sp. WAC 01325]|nr:hypothetical protein DMH25_07830 [Streptomyces sp. WAC 01325]
MMYLRFGAPTVVPRCGLLFEGFDTRSDGGESPYDEVLIRIRVGGCFVGGSDEFAEILKIPCNLPQGAPEAAFILGDGLHTMAHGITENDLNGTLGAAGQGAAALFQGADGDEPPGVPDSQTPVRPA